MGKSIDKRRAKRKAVLKKRAANEKKRVAKLKEPRKCNGCDVCCTVFGVPDIEKDIYERCDFLCEKGCKIYTSRPKHCKEFYCLWQMRLGTMNERPDKLRVVFAPTVGKTKITGQQEIQAYEVDEGAFDLPEVVNLCRRLANNGALILGHVYGKNHKFRIMGDQGKVMKARTFMATHNGKMG